MQLKEKWYSVKNIFSNLTQLCISEKKGLFDQARLWCDVLFKCEQDLTWGSLAYVSCFRNCHRWSAGVDRPEWSACCLEQERNPSGGSDGPRQIEWGWPEDPLPGVKQTMAEIVRFQTPCASLAFWKQIICSNHKAFSWMWDTFFSTSRSSRTSLRRKSCGVSLWGSRTVKSVTISVQICKCCRGLWYGFNCRSDTDQTHYWGLWLSSNNVLFFFYQITGLMIWDLNSYKTTVMSYVTLSY